MRITRRTRATHRSVGLEVGRIWNWSPPLRTVSDVAMEGSAKPIWRIVVLSTLVFVAKAFFLIPIFQRGLIGHGLYTFVSEEQFYELAAFTFFAVVCWARLWELLDWPRTLAAAAGAVLVNIGALIVDVRAHEYDPSNEGYIRSHYGSPMVIWTIAVCLLACGAVVLRWVARWQRTR